jgi:outer membrane protein assembly factor BamB
LSPSGRIIRLSGHLFLDGMRNELQILPQALPISVGLLSAVLLWVWLFRPVSFQIEQRVPGADRAPARTDAGVQTNAVFLGHRIVSGTHVVDLPGAWTGFRGNRGDGIAREEVGLSRSWDPAGPRTLWRLEVGEGYAGAAILAGRVYVMDYDQDRREDALRCLSLADGVELWRYTFPDVIKRNHGMSRTVPFVGGGRVVAIGPRCHVICADAQNGELKWALDLVQDFGAVVPPWYAGQCPLVTDDTVVLAPGGKDALMIGVDLETGSVRWKTPNPNGWKMTHSSIVPMEFAGKATYVYCANRGVVGVSAEDGSILWETTEWKISIATIPSPVVLDQGRIFLTGGYDSGSLMLGLREEAGRVVAEPLFRLEPEVFGATQHTPILHGKFLYGVRADGQMVCLGLDGTPVWTSGTDHTYGLGSFLIADGMIFAMNDSGLLSLIELRPDRFQELASAQVLDGHESWGPLSLAGGRLIARDFKQMICLDVGVKAIVN